MNVMACSSEVSGCCKQINGTTVFYYFPRDPETLLIKGLNVICALAEIGQWSISKLHDSDNEKLSTEAHENAPMKCRKCVEDTDGGLKTDEGWSKPTKCIPITCFCKNNNNSKKC